MRQRETEAENEQFGGWARLVRGQSGERLARNTTVFTTDDAADHLLLLTRGQVNLTLDDAERRTLTLRVVQPGQVFGLVSLAGDQRYDSTAETVTAAHIYRIDRDTAVGELRADGTLALALLEELGEHRLAVSRRLDEVAFKSVPARLASVLLDLAPADDGQDRAQLVRRSHRQLAEMINAYRETVTKVINQFAAARLLEIDRYTITLLSRTRLEELAQGW